MPNPDLIILGGGPAGISTALHLLEIDPGWRERLLILEKDAHPRHKLCAGGVTRYGMEVLRRLGFPQQLPLAQVPICDARLSYGGQVVHVRARPYFTVFQRAEFDAYLAQEARRRGVRLLENTPVEQLELGPDAVRASTPADTFHARAAVGADGSKGIARRLVQRSAEKQRVARLLEVVHPATAAEPPFQEGSALFDFNPAENHLQGYSWEFPSRVAGEPRFNRGVYDARLAAGRPRARLPEVLAGSLEAWGAGVETGRLQGHPIHWFSPRGTFSRPRLLLVGDAAGVDPLFGEGIGPALGYGEVAARAIQAAFQGGEFSFRHFRRQVLASPVGRYLTLRWAVAWWAYRFSDRPWFLKGIFAVGGLLAGLHNRLIR